jgi:hypothetical protein
MQKLACVALLGVGCTATNPAYDGGDAGSSSGTRGDDGISSGLADAGSTSEGPATGGATVSTVTTDAVASSSSGGDLDCPEECGDNATCVAAGSGPECACDRGYEGDGLVCMPVPTLASLAWQLDCMGGSPTCTGDEVCAVEAPMDDHEVVRTDSAILLADPETIYEVVLQVRAVVEPKAYMGGDTNTHWNEGGEPVPDQWNVAYIAVEDPPRLIHVNAGPPAATYCLAIDQGLLVRMRGGSQLEIGTSDPNNCSVINVDEPGGAPISLPDVDAPAQPHDGQFMLVDVMTIEPE